MAREAERAALLSSALIAARRIATKKQETPAGAEAWANLLFCVQHGYIGHPSDSPTQFFAGGYLKPGRNGVPGTQGERDLALGIVLCFQDDVIPCVEKPAGKIGGIDFRFGSFVLPREKLLVLADADTLSPFEVGLRLIHEARHARQLFGRLFEGLPPLDPEPLHEARTWKHWLTLLDNLGDWGWNASVEAETELVGTRYKERKRNPGDRFFAMSGIKYRSLDTLFGSPQTDEADYARSILVGMRANFRLAERLSTCELDPAYANIVGAYYDLAAKAK